MQCCRVHSCQLGDRQTRAQALPSTVRSPVLFTEILDRRFGGIVWGVAAGGLGDRTLFQLRQKSAIAAIPR